MGKTTLPAMPACTSCGECCTIVSARPDELKRIRRYLDDTGEAWVIPEADPMRCGFLRDVDGKKVCGIYDVRPWICRAFGVTTELKCSYFPDAVVLELQPEDAVRRRLVDPKDLTLGEAFEPGFLKRLDDALAAANPELPYGVFSKSHLAMKSEAPAPYGHAARQIVWQTFTRTVAEAE